MRYKLSVCFVLFLFAGLFPCWAQKVAVVLSGGGAKGVSHIGVLKALEEAQVPIDYIAGTSMGAIIGGLYAAGYSPVEMEYIITSRDFKEWVSGKIDQKYIYYFRQPFPDASWMSFKFKYDSVLQTQLPTNLVSPVSMDFAFLELFASAAAAANYKFDSLMVPFRCVAADVDENKAVTLRSGDLGSAIRASMTFPFYFKPIRIDGRLLFDGGMYNNFPSDVAYEDFYPDIIIGSKAANNARPPADDDVLSQIRNMLMEKSNYDVLCESGVMIEPQLKTVNVIDFSHTTEFIDSGYVAAKRMIPQIRKFVLDSVSPEQREAIRSEFNKRKPPYVVKNYTIEGITEGQYSYVKKLLRTDLERRKKTGDTSRNQSLGIVKADYFRLLAENRVYHSYPQLTYSPSLKGYELHISAKQENNFHAEIGGNVSSKSTNEFFLQLGYIYWNKIAASFQSNAYLGRFYNSFKVGGRLEFPSRLPFFVEMYLIGNQFNYMNTSNTYFFDFKTPVYLVHRENFIDLRLGFPIKRTGKIEIGFDMGRNRDSYYQTNTFTTDDVLDKTLTEFYSPSVTIEFNNLNRKQFANSGERFQTEFRFISANEEHSPGTTGNETVKYEHWHNYPAASLSYEKYFRKKGFYTLGIMAETMISFQDFYRNYTSTILISPAFTPIPEMSTLFQNTFRNPIYAAVGQRNVASISKNFDLRIEGYLMVPYREIIQGQDLKASYGPVLKKAYPAASASLIYQSPIGPLSLSYSYYNQEQKPFSFLLNLGYLLYNRPSLR
ncbi:MAG: patatin-like phospholipase family protein [Bacteroidetes bacterium]|nr:patatin-like phospholipase family protein [Bacteroidota bacterium]